MIGLGVGIDYALFIVTRHRNNLKAGMSPAVRALNTSGRAVLFAGTTVCVALLGMLVLRIGYISGLGIAAAITVLFTVAAAATHHQQGRAADSGSHPSRCGVRLRIRGQAAVPAMCIGLRTSGCRCRAGSG